MKTRSKNYASGFTLIELLVAMAITTIIISILVSVTALSLDAWNRSRSEVRAARQGKAMIDSMARDFESIVVRKGNNFEWLFAESNPSSDGPNSTASPNAVDLFFFSAATDRYDGNVGDTGPGGQDKGGDVSTVGYQLVYKDPINTSVPDETYNTFVLYRKLLDPDKTFGVAGAEGTLGKTDLKSAFNAVIGSETIDDEVNFICENVYEFTVTFRVDVTMTSGTPPNTTSSIKSVTVPIGKGTGASGKLRILGSGLETTFAPSGAGAPTNAQLKAGRLSSIEISLTVLTDFGLKQLRSRTLGDAEKAEFIAKNSYRYSKLVQVPGS